MKKKRKWMYVQKPVSYEIVCDKCASENIAWSEFEGCIWCYDCKIDTPGTGGIFGGPIPLEIANMMGISFDRYFIKDKTIRKMMVKDGNLIWVKKEKKDGNKI